MLIEMQHQVVQFIKTCKSPKTAICYEGILRRLADWLSARGLEYYQITPEIFEDFLNENRGWKAVSRYLAYNVTRAFLRWLLGENHPLAGLKMKRPKSKPQRTITQDQFNTLLEHFNTMSPMGARDLALFSVAAETGLRATALCNIKLRDVHLDSLTIIAIDKGNEWVACKISPLVASYITAWLAYREGIAKPETDTLFCSVRGKKAGLPNDRNGFKSRCNEISKKVGFRFSPHVFRRFMATRFTELGGESAAIRQGGWKTMEEFRKYIRSYQIPDVSPYSPVMNHMTKGKSS